MGFTEEEVARMQELDARRDARWPNGLDYMRERERIVATFEGEFLEEELQHLRERHFGYEAETIAREERHGFFRYERPRIYGRN
jgi:lipase chaperone LimK